MVAGGFCAVGRYESGEGSHGRGFPAPPTYGFYHMFVSRRNILKLAAATLGTAVAFEVDRLDDMRHTGWSVVLKGPAVELNELGEVFEAEALKVEPWAEGSRERYFRITPVQVTGRRIPGS